MAEYKIEGTCLWSKNGSKVGEFDGRDFRDACGTKVGEIDGNSIRDASGTKVGEIDGQDIRGSNGSKIGTLSDARKDIDGIGGASLAGFWVLFVR